MKLFKTTKGLGLIFTAILLIVLLMKVVYIPGYFITSLSPLVNSVAKNKIINQVRDYQILETKNFIIRYKEVDEEAAILTKKIAEDYYTDVCSMFNYYPDEKVNIIVYNTDEELLKNTKLKREVPPLGVYYGGIIHVLSPNLWIDDKENLNYIFEKEGPIVHEFAHLIVDQITRGNYPMWLTEGIALYTEYKVTGFEWGKGMDIDEDISVEQLMNDFYGIDQNIAYAKSFNIVKDMSSRWGFEKMVFILNTLGEGNSLNTSTETVLKVGLNDLN